jgi:hypothetical protein
MPPIPIREYYAREEFVAPNNANIFFEVWQRFQELLGNFIGATATQLYWKMG